MDKQDRAGWGGNRSRNREREREREREERDVKTMDGCLAGCHVPARRENNSCFTSLVCFKSRVCVCVCVCSCISSSFSQNTPSHCKVKPKLIYYVFPLTGHYGCWLAYTGGWGVCRCAHTHTHTHRRRHTHVQKGRHERARPICCTGWYSRPAGGLYGALRENCLC